MLLEKVRPQTAAATVQLLMPMLLPATHTADPSPPVQAYAKLHKSYENLIGGFVDYGLRDLTGGVTQQLKIDTGEWQVICKHPYGSVLLYSLSDCLLLTRASGRSGPPQASSGSLCCHGCAPLTPRGTRSTCSAARRPGAARTRSRVTTGSAFSPATHMASSIFS